MKLLDIPFTYQEKNYYLDMLKGCISRICVSDEPNEIIQMLGFANDYLNMLAQNNMLRIKEKEKE